MTTDTPFLVLDGLSAVYGTTKAVDAVRLSVARGELLALLGPSGCGKTTTLRMIAGFVPPSSGTVRVNGADITRAPAHQRGMGVVFQSYALFPHLTVLDNVAFGLRMQGLSAVDRRAKAGSALEMVALSQLAGRYPHQLSGGQQQRVALARALVVEPDVLLLDEPLSNLDANLRAELRTEIRRLQQRLSITTVFVTHDQEEALAMSDRVAVMDRGRLVEVGTPAALCDHPADAFTAGFLGARTVIAGATEAGQFHAPGLVCADAPADAHAIVLRAARLRLGDSVTGSLQLGGTISSSTYLGDVFEIDMATGAGTIRVVLPSDTSPQPVGTPCQINALPGGVSFIT
jgi:putative spermidine/putrescine transport system ATP-binding protein